MNPSTIKINDAHVHLGPSGPWTPDFDPSTSIEEIIDFSKEIGVERCIIFPNPAVGLEYFECNKTIIEAANSYPKLFIPFGRIDPRYKEISIKEIRKLAHKGVVGVKLHPRVECFRPDHKFFLEVFNEIQRFGMIILSHSGTGFSEPEYWKPVIEKFRNLRLILAHFNERCVELLKNYDNVYADTSASNFLFIEKKIEILEIHEKLLFGSDYPYIRNVKEYIQKILKLKLPSKVKNAILYNNFNKILS